MLDPDLADRLADRLASIRLRADALGREAPDARAIDRLGGDDALTAAVVVGETLADAEWAAEMLTDLTLGLRRIEGREPADHVAALEWVANLVADWGTRYKFDD